MKTRKLVLRMKNKKFILILNLETMKFSERIKSSCVDAFYPVLNKKDMRSDDQSVYNSQNKR